jgi:hypothetical protein
VVLKIVQHKFKFFLQPGFFHKKGGQSPPNKIKITEINKRNK